jgi:hypothetical protein
VVYKQLTTQDFEEIVEKAHLALKDFYKGNPEPYNQLYSSAKDISLLGAQGGIAVGEEEIAQHLTSRASWFRAGENVSFEKLVKFSTQDLGYIVEIERFEAKVAGTDEVVHIALKGYDDLQARKWRMESYSSPR